MSKNPRPHHDDEDEPRKPRKKGAQVATWMMMGMLILGLGGFGITSFGGSVTSVGSVGPVTISTTDYARAIRQEINSFSQQLGTQIGVTEAMAFGLDQRALSGVVTRAGLDAETTRLGLSIGDASVAAEIRKDQTFMDAAGGFSRDAYSFTLQQNGWSESDYEETVRDDVSRQILRGAVSGGMVAPQAMVDALYRYTAERRSLSLIRLTEGDLPAPLAEPTDADLQAWYDGHIADFTKPESKRVAYVALLPEDIAADQPVDEATLKAMYDERIAEFVQPDRRLVERLVFPDQAAADAAKAKLDAGTPFEDLVKERGLELSDIDLGDVPQADLGAAGAVVFAGAEGAIVAAESQLGPALFRINGVLAGENISFEEARPELAAELQTEAARKAIDGKVEQIDDLLAGGAELKDLASEMGMTFAQLDHVQGAQGEEKIEGYAAFRAAADAVAEGDFAEAITLDDGGVAALQFIETVSAAPIPFDKVREKVAEAWTAAQLEKALSDRALAIKTAVEGGASLGAQGIVDQAPELPRNGTIKGAPQSAIETAFTMAPGEIRVIDEGGFVAVLQLNSVIAAEETGANADALKAAIAAQIGPLLSDDVFVAYSNAILAANPVQLDQAAINAVNSSLQ